MPPQNADGNSRPPTLPPTLPTTRPKPLPKTYRPNWEGLAALISAVGAVLLTSNLPSLKAHHDAIQVGLGIATPILAFFLPSKRPRKPKALKTWPTTPTTPKPGE